MEPLWGLWVCAKRGLWVALVLDRDYGLLDDYLMSKKIEWKYNPVFSVHPNGYTEIWEDGRLSFKAKGLWGYMKSKGGKWDFSADRMASESSDGRKTVLTAMKELEECGYLNRRKLGDGRVKYELSGESYVGIEPEIVRSPFEGAKVNMEHGSMYDGVNDYRNGDGSVGTIGKPVPMSSFEEEFICINDCIEELKDTGMSDRKARKVCDEFWKACDEGGIGQSKEHWKKWKKVYLPILEA